MIPDHFTTQFGRNFNHAAQQTQSVFREFAIVETGCTGEAKTHNLILPTEDEETTGERYKKTVLKDLESEKRWIRPRMFSLPTGESFWDERLLAPTILPGGKHLEAHLSAYNRRADKVFIEGVFGTNYKGKEGVTVANIPAENIIDVDYVPNNGTPVDSGMTPSKIARAKKILAANFSYDQAARRRGVRLRGVMHPDDEEYILNLSNAGQNHLLSREWGTPILDADGHITKWLGIDWMLSTQLPLDEADDEIRYGGIWTSDAVHLDFWQEIKTSVSIRNDLHDATQFLSQYSMNACRSEDDKVVKIGCMVAA